MAAGDPVIEMLGSFFLVGGVVMGWRGAGE